MAYTRTQALAFNLKNNLVQQNIHKFDIMRGVLNLYRCNRPPPINKKFTNKPVTVNPTILQRYLPMRHWISENRIWITNHSLDPYVKKIPKQKPNRAVRTSTCLPNLHFHFFCVRSLVMVRRNATHYNRIMESLFLLRWTILIQAQEEEEREIMI
jgi:hypothetical protein